MTISEICIRRPVFTWVLVAIPVVLGAVSYFELGVDLFPKVDFPVVSVTANLPGTSPQEMETSVTRLIEEAINTVSGVDELRSTVREGMTAVIVQFVLEKDGDVAAQEIRDKISAIMKQLPEGIDPPLVDKFDLDSAPIMTIGISGRRDVREVTEIAKHEIQEVLPQVPGIGRVFLSGGRTRAINIVLDTHQLIAYGLSVEDVRQALVTQHLEVPGGIVQQGPRELVLRTLGRIKTAAQFDELIVTTRRGYPIRVKDVGRTEDSIEEPRGLTRMDGENAVSLFIQKQSGTNTIKVVDGVNKLLANIRKRLPADIDIEVVNDQSRFVRRSMEEVKFHLLLAGVLVSLTILLFIRDWRTTVIATLAIPTSIIPTFLFMSRMGYTLNNITMLALILAIGIVIDDAVVVHENIFRHMEEGGLDAMAAARKGTKEIALAVLATSLSLVVIFVPVAFMGGMVGRFFSSFGMTVAFAILMSLFVSFTLTPMLCSRFLKLDPAESGHAGSKSGVVYRLIDWIYGKSLRFALRFRILVVAVCVLVVLATGPIAGRMGFNLVPRDDQSEFQITIITPEEYTLERADRVFGEIEERIAKLPGVTHRFTVIGENNNSVGKGQGDVTRGSIYVRMKELEEREYTQFEVMQRARRILAEYPDLRTAVIDVSSIQRSGQDSRVFHLLLSGPELEKLASYSDALIKKLRQIPGLADVDSTMSLRKPEVQVSIDRERASDLGIPVQTIATTLNVLVGGSPISRFTDGAEQYDIWLRADRQFRANPQQLDLLSIPSPKVGLVELSSLAKVTESRGPSQIDRFNRQRTVTILANPEKISLSEAKEKSQQALASLNLPPQYQAEFSGQSKTLEETAYYFFIALGLSISFMYLILAAQFESWMNPLAILSALPVTIPFGLLSLVLFRQPMDLYAMFGLFMLVGIVKKNGILQVDKTNELRRAGLPRERAILEANHTRLRPILMTTMMLIAAMIPIALGQGPGAGARASMAKVIIGGQMLSLLLALLVTPVTYSLLDSLTGLFGWKRAPNPAPQLASAATE
ncbi:MAG: efflux RND transporter permease subunit [Planctomycetia bacterium]|nr:efflux RND transporter permease subunit [Planctomycetia bacterium]